MPRRTRDVRHPAPRPAARKPVVTVRCGWTTSRPNNPGPTTIAAAAMPMPTGRCLTDCSRVHMGGRRRVRAPGSTACSCATAARPGVTTTSAAADTPGSREHSGRAPPVLRPRDILRGLRKRRRPRRRRLMSSRSTKVNCPRRRQHLLHLAITTCTLRRSAARGGPTDTIWVTVPKCSNHRGAVSCSRARCSTGRAFCRS